MIHIDRSPVPPAIPVYVEVAQKWKNATFADFERSEAIAYFTNPLNLVPRKKTDKKGDKSFSFKVYKNARLAEELGKIFGSKCAYCDSRFAHVTPKDIEHFRPKSEVDEAKVKLVPGYFWLAGDWLNLLVSCPDCNRPRKHSLPNQSEKVLLGKGTQFPLRDSTLRVRVCGPVTAEDPIRLLLDPCTDDPEDHLTYDEDGLIYPRQDVNGVESEMGAASIPVYALQRKALVEERLRVLNLVKYDLLNIRRAVRDLGELQKLGATDEQRREKHKDIHRLRDHLKEQCGATGSYLGMIRDYIRKTKAAGDFDDLIQNGIDPEKLLKVSDGSMPKELGAIV